MSRPPKIRPPSGGLIIKNSKQSKKMRIVDGAKARTFFSDFPIRCWTFNVHCRRDAGAPSLPAHRPQFSRIHRDCKLPVGHLKFGAGHGINQLRAFRNIDYYILFRIESSIDDGEI